MAKMQEMKVIKINDGVYNGAYNIDDGINFFWKINSDSFKNYFEKYFNQDDNEEFPDWDEWETYGTLKGWNETDLLIDMRVGEVISVPIEDIESIWQ